jgi:hypothetical protein
MCPDYINLPTAFVVSYSMQNIAFSRVLKMNGRVWEFNFRKLPGEQNAFHTDFTDAKDNRVQFVLFHDIDGTWKIKGTLVPSWVLNEIPMLSNVIDENVTIATR